MLEVIGIAIDPQERAWIERWQQEWARKATLVELIFEGLLLRPMILLYMQEKGLLSRPVDGFVIHTMNLDNATYRELSQGLKRNGFELFSTTGETDRPLWRA